MGIEPPVEAGDPPAEVRQQLTTAVALVAYGGSQRPGIGCTSEGLPMICSEVPAREGRRMEGVYFRRARTETALRVTHAGVGVLLVQSWRNAVTGSTRAARAAG